MKESDILDEQQIATVARLLRKHTGYVVNYGEQWGISVEDTVRYISVSSRLKEARESAGFTVKEVAKRLNCPQYRIRDAESNSMYVVGEILENYVRFLGLGPWYKEWSRKNPDLAKRISLQKAAKKKARAVGRSRSRPVRKSSGS